MKHEILAKLHTDFEHIVKKDSERGTEFWMARELQVLLGYAEWRNFRQVIASAKVACKNSGHEPGDHFVEVNKMVGVGSGAQREIDDVALTRYACYLIAQNGDPQKDEIAFAQTYFAVQTRKQEIIEQRLTEMERLQARKKLSLSEKELSQVIFEKLGNGQSFAIIRSKGDQALFGGLTTQDMKNKLGVPDNRPLADFLPTITIKAKDFANEITTFNVKRDDMKTETRIAVEHVKNNADVRKILTDRNIHPEALPPGEDAKKVQRRLESESKKLMPGRKNKRKS